MTMRVWGLVSLLLGLTAGCNPDKVEGKETGATCPDNSSVTYEGFVAPFMKAYCTRCHGSDVKDEDRLGAPSDHNFDNVQGILDEAVHIAETAAAGPDAVNTVMPPSGDKPSDEERKKLGEWIACQIESGTASDGGHDHDHDSDEGGHDAGKNHDHDHDAGL